MRKRLFIVAGILVAAAVAVALLWPRGPRVPSMFAASLPAACRQVLLVQVPDERSVTGHLWLMERDGESCVATHAPITVTIGHKGLAWGAGEHTASPPAGMRLKREGDGCSPAGVFRIPFAFGTAAAPDWLKLPYKQLTPRVIGVDDPKSKYYNQVVDNTQVVRDWDSNEPMMRHDRLYEWGAFIGHNPDHVPGGGSCIFLHLWPGPGRGTAGCTAMSAADLRMVLAWLDPAKDPRIIQTIDGWQ